MTGPLTPATAAAASPAARRAIPSLDGVRAFSIAMVILSHLMLAGVIPVAVASALNAYLGPGLFGVRVFFVISGFLITTLLLREAESEGTVNLVRFYLRRTLRIFPPYYAYIGVIAMFSHLRLVTVLPGEFARSLTYTVDSFAGSANGAPRSSWYLGHAWSLSVEEQFYLLWPAIILAATARRAWRIAVVVALLGPVVKAGLYLLMPPEARVSVGYSFLCALDGLATGCTLAALRPALQRSTWYPRLLASRGFWLIAPVSLLCWSGAGHWRVAMLTQTAAFVGIALCLDRVVTHADGPVGRVLNWAPVAWIGRLSYSIYLWQQLFTYRALGDNVLSNAGLTSLPWNLLATLSCAVASYYLIEEPSFRLRTWIEPRLPHVRRRIPGGTPMIG